MRQVRRKGFMLILSSPSGAGKTTLSRALLDREERLSISISVTTRPPRPSEEDGKDYIFVSREKFEAMRRDKALLEEAKVFGNLYGTPRAPVERKLAEGSDVLFDIDWQGAQQIRQKRAEDVVTVFLLPPSAKVLQDRISRRREDAQSVIETRMKGAPEEITHYAEYDYIVVNDGLETSLNQLRTILHAERLRRERQLDLIGFVDTLRKQLREPPSPKSH